MAQTRVKIEHRLGKSLSKGLVVRIERKNLEDAECVEGLVRQLTAEWVVIAKLDGVYPDGFDIVRRKDITKVRFRANAHQQYVERALSVIGHDQTTCPANLGPGMSVQAVLTTVSEKRELLGFYIEKETADVLFIGRIDEFRKKKFDLQFITPSGRWEEDLRVFRYKEITRIFFGGRYERGLADFGEPYPGQD